METKIHNEKRRVVVILSLLLIVIILFITYVIFFVSQSYEGTSQIGDNAKESQNELVNGAVPKTDGESPKKTDSIQILLQSLPYSGYSVATIAEAESGDDVILTYYSDSGCKNETTPNDSLSPGGPPKSIGTYYAIGKTSGNSDYIGATTVCTKAVVISEVPVANISIKEDMTVINIGQSIVFAARVFPENATNQKVVWTSTNESVATVNFDGEVVGKSTGVTTISATSSNGKVATVSVIVVENNILDYYLSPTLNIGLKNPRIVI